MVAWFAPSHLGNRPHQRFDENILIGQRFEGKINWASLFGVRWIQGHTMPEIA